MSIKETKYIYNNKGGIQKITAKKCDSLLLSTCTSTIKSVNVKVSRSTVTDTSN